MYIDLMLNKNDPRFKICSPKSLEWKESVLQFRVNILLKRVLCSHLISLNVHFAYIYVYYSRYIPAIANMLGYKPSGFQHGEFSDSMFCDII
jgi:hypothetical protein